MKFVQHRRLPVRHVLALAITLPAAAVVVVANDAGATDSADAAEPGGTVTYAVEQEYTAYNNGTGATVTLINAEVLMMVQPQVYIVQPDLTTTLNTDLMVSVEVTSEAPQVIEWIINPDAVWSDGEPIDCDDFYLDWIARNDRAGNRVDESGAEMLAENGEPINTFDSASTTGYQDIESLECSADGYGVTTTFSTPFPDYTGLFANFMPAHIVERESGVADVTTATDPVDLQALGLFWSEGFDGFDPELALSGSWYSIDSITAGETAILVRNENYWGTPGLVDEIVFRLIPNGSDQPAALGNGDVQIIAPQPEPDMLAQLADLSGVTTSLEQGVSFEHFDFNQAVPMLSELEVRQAISLCIDRQEIVDALVAPLNPDAIVLNSRIYMPQQANYIDNSDGNYAEQDLDASRALMEAAGFTVGDDGIYARDGERASFRIGYRQEIVRRQKTAELAIAQCAGAGIELTDDGTSDFNSDRLPASDYDIALFAWVGTPFQSSNTDLYRSGGNANWNSYSNPALDELFIQANQEQDQDLRAGLMNEIDLIMWNDMVSLPLFAHPQVMSYNEALENARYNDPLGPTWNANTWSLAVA